MKRHAPQQETNSLGQSLCRMPGCGKVVGKGRRSYCSRECNTEFSIRYFASAARIHVFHRDRGVCSKCNLDTEKVRAELRQMDVTARRQKIHEMGFNGFGSLYKGNFWQADHIHECARGGWGVGLDKLRTLCTPCHKEETARLARELASERKARKQSRGSLFDQEAA